MILFTKEPVGTPEQRQRARELTIELVQKYDRSLSFVELEREIPKTTMNFKHEVL